jgi:hypothetical protein
MRKGQHKLAVKTSRKGQLAGFGSRNGCDRAPAPLTKFELAKLCRSVGEDVESFQMYSRAASLRGQRANVNACRCAEIQ